MPDLDPLSLPEKLRQSTIMIIGDVMLDRTISGMVDRISPEAPIPVMRQTTTLDQCGGAANTALTLGTLNIPTVLIGVVGDDDTGASLQQILATQPEAQSITADLVCDPNRPTTIKQRFRSGNQQIFRLDNETTEPIDATLQDTLLAKVQKHVANVQSIVVSDYAKGALSEDTVQGIITFAQEYAIPVVIDPIPQHLANYRGADYLTPNRNELQRMLGALPKQDPALSAAITDFCRHHALTGLLLTRSEEGMSLFHPEENTLVHHYLPATAQEVYDVTGAGDTLSAVFAAAIASGYSVNSSASLANAAAAVVVSKVGSAGCSMRELIQQLFPKKPFEAKLYTLSTLVEQVTDWRLQGERIGFTNGCFDLLHPGHISVLQFCSSHCDRLIVAINADASVKKLKGKGRPVNNQHDRATMLLSLPQIDGVIIFEEETPLALLEVLKPDRLIKGGDYLPEEVVGAELLESYGGKVLIAPFKDGYATSNLVHKITRSNL